MKNEFQIKGAYTILLFVFKWYWLYKKKECNKKENAEETCIPAVMVFYFQE